MILNGADVGAFEGTVDALLETFSLPRTGVAVAIDGEIVPRSQWSTTSVALGATVEIVTAAAGG